MATRPDFDTLRAACRTLHWELRQLLSLATYLEGLREGQPAHTLREPLEAAALEAFVLHARALSEFLWGDPERREKRGRKTDALAADWFTLPSDPDWKQTEPPALLDDVRKRVGWGVAHISYNRVDPEVVWGWDHVNIAGAVAYRFAEFITDAPADRFPWEVRTKCEEELRSFFHEQAIADPWGEHPGIVGTHSISQVVSIPDARAGEDGRRRS